VSGFGSLWVDFDASYAAAVQADSAPQLAGEAEVSFTRIASAFQADADSAAGVAPHLSLPAAEVRRMGEATGAGGKGAVTMPATMAQRKAAALSSGISDALRTLYAPMNFDRMVDWRGVVAWLSITGPSPASSTFLEATLNAVHGDDKIQTAAQGENNASAVEADAGTADEGRVLEPLWHDTVLGGRDFMIQDITGYSTLVGKGWGVATWPQHEQLDELACHLEDIALNQLHASEGATSTPDTTAVAHGEGKVGEESKQQSMSVATEEVKRIPLRPGQLFVLQTHLTAHACSPQTPVEPADEEQGTPRSRGKNKAASKKGKQGKKGAAEEATPLVLQLRAVREWQDPLVDLGKLGATVDSALLPEVQEQLPLWFQRQGLHEKQHEDALVDIAAAAAAQGSDYGAGAATAEAAVDELISTVSAQRAAASAETGGAVGWHHISGDHSSREALYLADMSTRAQLLRGQQEEETLVYSQLADRDVAASVEHGDRIMRAVLLQGMSDVYGRLDFGRIIRQWRRHAEVQDQIIREEVQEGIQGRGSKGTNSAASTEAALAKHSEHDSHIRFTLPASHLELAAEVAQAEEAATLPAGDSGDRTRVILDVYQVLLQAVQQNRLALNHNVAAGATDPAEQEGVALQDTLGESGESEQASSSPGFS
jgi:hypothetical protein